MLCFGNNGYSIHICLGCCMITINIACVGSLKEKFWKDAIAEYSKRIGAYAKLNIYEVKESDYGTSQKQIDIAKREEAERLNKYIKGHCIALEIDGKEFDSQSFAKHIGEIINNDSTITFFIGGSYGLDKSFSNQFEHLSFSHFTFPHQLMRVILAEQIYRSFTILSGKTYHK